MMTLRCTRRLLKWLKIEPSERIAPATNALGDWFANLLFTRHHRLVFCINERSLLSVLVPVKGMVDIESSLITAVHDLLVHLGFPAETVIQETNKMKPMQVGFTTSRVVLGSMNDMIFQSRFLLERHGQDLLRVAELLADTPCSPLRQGYPIKVARELLSAGSTGLLH
jgi:hypothetical protein